MKDFDFKQLDDIIHSRIRLAIISVLISVEEAEFTFLKNRVKATDGNLSTHLKKLEEVKYIAVKKEFIDRKPATSYRLTESGKEAFSAYVERLENLIKK
ncbi:MAG: transcriptional regulator [Melioribacteraceae bacterium]|nr:transcriptional regulator [Melioribacteraceae bacterium]